MKLLIVTQVVDREHSNLGFFHGQIEALARACEQIHVITLQEGVHALPSHVTVHSLGKESGVSRLGYLLRFYRLIGTLRSEYDAVFVHMNPQYVVLGGILWRLWNKRIGLWYVHKSITLWLRVAAFVAHVIFTVSPASIGIRSKKIRVVGHGIDTERFSPGVRAPHQGLRIVSIGRIAASKGLREILLACDELHRRAVDFTLTIIGTPLTEEERIYAGLLKDEIGTRSYKDRVQFAGAVAYAELPGKLRESDVLVNISATGGYDKVVLEALACGIPAISSSAPFRSLLAGTGLFLEDNAPEILAETITAAASIDVTQLRAEVEARHSLTALTTKILSSL